MNPRLLLPAALAVAVPAGLGALGVGSAPLRVKPGGAGFTRIVLGVTPEGLLRGAPWWGCPASTAAAWSSC